LEYAILIVIVVMMFGMMFLQSRKAKQQQAERQDFRANLQPGTEIITIGGVIGKVVSVDTEYEEIVIDSEGSLLRFAFNAINREYVRPAYVHDDEVDEDGNPLPQESDGQVAQEPIENVNDGLPQVVEAETAAEESKAEPKNA
jgi:preprotein translocase subunit YajC